MKERTHTPLSSVGNIFEKSWLAYEPKMKRLALFILIRQIIGLIVFVLTSAGIAAAFWIPFSKLFGMFISFVQSASNQPAAAMTLSPAFNALTLKDIVLALVGVFLWWAIIYFVNAFLVASQWQMVIAPETITIKETLKRGSGAYSAFVRTQLMSAVIIAIGLFLFVVPGIIFAGWFMFAPIFASTGNSVIQSLKKSRELMVGRWWPLALRVVLAYLIAVFIPQIIAQAFFGIKWVGPAIGIIVAFGVTFFTLPWFMVFRATLRSDADRAQAET